MATAKDEKAGWNDATNGAAANQDGEGWGQTVDAESQIILENEGDGFIGQFIGMDAPNAKGIVQAHFENVYDILDNYQGYALFINAGRDLEQKLRKVPEKSLVRVQWISSMNTGQKTPMRVYSVQWR